MTCLWTESVEAIFRGLSGSEGRDESNCWVGIGDLSYF